MKLIDEVDVKMALEKGTSDLKIIHKRILDLYDELIEVDSVIRSVAMKSPKYGNIGGGVGGIKKDLADIMLRHEQTARARGIELREEMYRLTEEEESINRIQACFVIQLLGDNQTIWAWVIKLGIIAAMVFLVKDLIVISDEKDREGE